MGYVRDVTNGSETSGPKQMQMQNLHQSYDEKIQSLTLDCDRQIQNLQSKYDRTCRTKKNNYSLRKNFMKPRDIGITIMQGTHLCQTYLYPHPTPSQHT